MPSTNTDISENTLANLAYEQYHKECEDMCNDFAVKVDEKYIGGQRGEGGKLEICDFEWESLSTGGEEGN